MYTNKITGWLSNWDCAALSELAAAVPAQGNIIEIGSCMGKSAVAFAESVPYTVQIWCVDLFPESELINSFAEQPAPHPEFGRVYKTREEFKNNTRQFKNIHMIQGRSPECFAINSVINNITFDLVFLDASHRNPNDLDNIEYFLPRIRSGGVFAGHDNSPEFPDVQTNIALLETRLNQPVTKHKHSSVWSFKIA